MEAVDHRDRLGHQGPNLGRVHEAIATQRHDLALVAGERADDVAEIGHAGAALQIGGTSSRRPGISNQREHPLPWVRREQRSAHGDPALPLAPSRPGVGVDDGAASHGASLMILGRIVERAHDDPLSSPHGQWCLEP
jgi:hypothetical protein